MIMRMRQYPAIRRLSVTAAAVLLLAACAHGTSSLSDAGLRPSGDTLPPAAAGAEYGDVQREVEWYLERAMLARAPDLTAPWSGSGRQWQEPFGLARPEDLLGLASVWFNAYPASLITRPGQTVLQSLADPALLDALEDIGIEAIHTGPMKRAGSVHGMHYGPTIDGHFDRIELVVDPEFGSDDQYRQLVASARERGISIIGDMVPGHTGKGPDFRLAELGVPGFAGLYAMVEIRPDDWDILPDVRDGEDSANLSREAALTLKEKGYIVGPLDAVIFKRPGIKETNWSATGVIRGVDGVDRRWVYVHFFKQGQPSLNWLDPSFAAHRLMAADILHSVDRLGVRALRLDANMFLGFGPRAGQETGWLSEHPLSTVATVTLAMLIRKVGGFSFQELNVSLDKIRETLESGPELGYDFTMRPAYLYALATGDAGPLRLMQRLMLEYGVRPMRMVHGMQNHDELMLETTHLRVHGDSTFGWEGAEGRGSDLFEQIYARPIALTTGQNGPYNERFAMSPGVCATLASFTAASLGHADLATLSDSDIRTVRQRHLAAAAYNALQPGAFVISGWDLVGALPVDRESVRDLLKDNDCRWLNRGAYDLAGVDPSASESEAGLPRAVALYGSLPDQLADPQSFASTVRRMLAVRRQLGIDRGRLVAVSEVESASLDVFVVELPQGGDRAGRRILVAVNFGNEPVEQVVRSPVTQAQATRLVFSTLVREVQPQAPTREGYPLLRLAPSEAQALLLDP